MRKYLHIRQVVVFYIILVAVSVYSVVLVSDPILLCMLSIFISVTGICFTPVIRREIDTPEILHRLLYYFPMYIWVIDLFVHHDRYLIQINWLIRICSVLIVVFLLLLRKTTIIKIINSNDANLPIKRKRFIKELLFSILAIISEEILFTFFVVSNLSQFGFIWAVGASAISFVLAHYINRWAQKMFKIEDYIFIFILGIVKAVAFFYTKDLLFIILLHAIYNCFDFYLLIKKFRHKQKEEKPLFDDY